MASFLNLYDKAFGYPFVWYPFGCLFNSTHGGIKTDGLQNGKVSLEGKELGPWRFRRFYANQSSDLIKPQKST